MVVVIYVGVLAYVKRGATVSRELEASADAELALDPEWSMWLACKGWTRHAPGRLRRC